MLKGCVNGVPANVLVNTVAVTTVLSKDMGPFSRPRGTAAKYY